MNSRVMIFAIVLIVSLNLLVDCQQITVNPQSVVQNVSPDLFGIFFEEINHAGTGGIYGELVQNRDFEAPLSSKSLPHRLPLTRSKSSSPLPFQQYISLQSISHSSFFIRHCDYLGYISEIDSTLDQQDSTFLFHSSLWYPSNTSTVSFESYDFPGFYLRHQDFRLKLEQYDGTLQFKKDSSFFLVASSNKSAPNLYMFESIDYPGYYINFNASNDPSVCGNLGTKFDLFLNPYVDSSEFIINSTFEITKPDFVPTIPAWYASASNPANQNYINISITNDHPLTSNATSSLLVNISSDFVSKGNSDYVSVMNTGYWGINVVSGNLYNFTFYVRAPTSPSPTFYISVWLERGSDQTPVTSQYNFGGPFSADWKQFSTTIKALTSDSNCTLVIAMYQSGIVGLDFVSLFPQSTWNGSPNGNRMDLMNLVDDLHPKFVRFPGGCYIEGQSLANSYKWKQTIGPLIERPGHQGVWGYWSNDGMGYYEYLRWIEQLGAKPIWVVNIGISFTQYIPSNQLGDQIQEVLDSIEFANGDPSKSYWASLRAKYGHPEPFNLGIMALGNEDCFKFPLKVYTDRALAFAEAIKKQYPNMKLIVNCQQALSSFTNNSTIDYWDYHVYSDSNWFISNREVFANYPTSGPRVFVSEYAMTQNAGIGNLLAAVSEAAFMTGLVRYSNAAPIASYAPLFVNVNNRYWNPDMIQYNSSAVAPTPSYYCQQLFSLYTGSDLLATADSGLDSISYVATKGKNSNNQGVVWLNVVNWGSSGQSIGIKMSGGASFGSNVVVRTLTSGSSQDQNTLDNPQAVITKKSQTVFSNPLQYQFPAWSVTVFEFILS